MHRNLFLGFRVTTRIAEELAALPKERRALLLSSKHHPLYLQSIEIEGVPIIGRSYEGRLRISTLGQITSNICTLAAQLLPHTHHQIAEIELFALPDHY